MRTDVIRKLPSQQLWQSATVLSWCDLPSAFFYHRACLKWEQRGTRTEPPSLQIRRPTTQRVIVTIFRRLQPVHLVTPTPYRPKLVSTCTWEHRDLIFGGTVKEAGFWSTHKACASSGCGWTSRACRKVRARRTRERCSAGCCGA